MSIDHARHVFTQLPPISRALAVHDWPTAFRLMDEQVGYETAGRWLVEELEIAGVIEPEAERTKRAANGHGPQLP